MRGFEELRVSAETRSRLLGCVGARGGRLAREVCRLRERGTAAVLREAARLNFCC